MFDHKFEVGEVVAFRQSRLSPTDEFEILRQLPPGDDGAVQYRLKSLATGQERVSKEGVLRSDPSKPLLDTVDPHKQRGSGKYPCE
jgi:hypothetical protein